MRRPIAALLADLRAIDEQPSIEAKRSLSEDAFPTISAFSNEPDLGGGILLLGVSRIDGRYEAVGVADPDRVSSDVSSACAGEKFNRRLRPTVWSEVVEGKVVVGVAVPEARPGDKPIYLPKVGLPKGAYRRIGSADVRCSDDDIRLFHQRALDRPYEDTIVTDATMEDLDLDVVASYRTFLLDANPSTELRDLALLELVQALGGARLEDGELRPTVCGVLLFGKPLALKRLFPMWRVDYIRQRGTEWIEDTERRLDAIDVRQPLLVAFRKIYQAIIDDLPRTTIVPADSPHRIEQGVIPDRVVREALVNALCHRDYRLHSPIQVIRYRDRIEFRNAGHSLVVDDDLGRPVSRSRNPRVADVFRDMELAENRGTGVRVMRREMEQAGLKPPEFLSSRESDLFVTTLWLPTEGVVTPQVTPPVAPPVTPPVARLVEVLEGEMSPGELMTALGLTDRKHFRAHYRDAALALGVIEMTDPDKPSSRNQRYRLTELGRRIKQEKGPA